MAYWNGVAWAPERLSPTRARTPSLSRRIKPAALVAMGALVMAASAAFAGKATSSVWVNELGASRTPGGALQVGDHFTVGYASREREPFALARCYPNSSTTYSMTYADGSVWGEVFSVYDGGPTPQDFQLGASVAPVWTGGGADCTVELVKYGRDLARMTVLATTSFTAQP